MSMANSFTLTEHVDPEQILECLKSRLLDQNHAARLAKYYNLAVKHVGKIPVTYKKKTSGRYYPEEGGPLYSLYQWRAVRSLLSEGQMDVDAEKCHPTILLYLVKRFGGDAPLLQQFIDKIVTCSLRISTLRRLIWTISTSKCLVTTHSRTWGN